MAKARSEYYTRTRLLNQLGLFQEPLTKLSGPGTTSSSSLSSSSSFATRAAVDGSCSSTECQHHMFSHGSMVPFEVKLNDSWQDSTGFLTESSCNSSINSDSVESCKQQQQEHQQHHHIHFKDTVSVMPIPSRYQYSDRIKQRIWSNRIELREMAQRNMIEFESEGFDWRNVVLEEDMYIDASNGNYIHPCHVHRSYYPQISSVGRATEGCAAPLQEEVGSEEDEAEDEYHHFAPLRRLDSRVMA